MNAALTWMSEEPRHRTGADLLRKAFGLVIIYRILTELRYATYFWGGNGLHASGIRGVMGLRLGKFLDGLMDRPLVVFLVLGILLCSSIALLVGYRTRIATFVTWVLYLLIELRLPELADGGDNVMRLCLFYMLLLLPKDGVAQSGSLRVWMHNIGVLAIVGQILIVYTTSGLMKARGIRWHQGTALYLVSQVEWFSSPNARAIFRSPYVTTIATYATVLFQVWFPVAIFSRLRLIWLGVAIFFHVGIAAMMGLLTFSAVMTSLDLFLLSDVEWQRIRVRVSTLRLTAANFRRDRLSRWPTSPSAGSSSDPTTLS